MTRAIFADIPDRGYSFHFSCGGVRILFDPIYWVSRS